MARRDTYNYSLKDGRKVVYKGITSDPDARIEEHADSGKRFTHMVVEGPPRTRRAAREGEIDALEAYRRSHGGRNPKYNIRRDG